MREQRRGGRILSPEKTNRKKRSSLGSWAAAKSATGRWLMTHCLLKGSQYL